MDKITMDEVLSRVETNLGINFLNESQKALEQLENEQTPFTDKAFITKGDIVFTKNGEGKGFIAVLVDGRLILATLNPNSGKKHDLKAINVYNAELDSNRVYLSDLKARLTSFKDCVIIDKEDVDHIQVVYK